jgi:hypothetical protein
MSRPKLNLEGLNEQQREEVIEQYEDWVVSLLTEDSPEDAIPLEEDETMEDNAADS